MIGLTSTLAAEWGGRGVRVNAVCPGWIKTEMDAEDQASGAYSDADIANQVPLARFAAPEDVAQAVAFLADPAQERVHKRGGPAGRRRLGGGRQLDLSPAKDQGIRGLEPDAQPRRARSGGRRHFASNPTARPTAAGGQRPTVVNRVPGPAGPPSRTLLRRSRAFDKGEPVATADDQRASLLATRPSPSSAVGRASPGP